MKIIHTNKAPAAIGPYSQAIVHNGLLYTSGQVALNTEGNVVEGDITVQTTQVFGNLGAVLAEANSSFDKVIKTTCFISDMDNFAAMNEVYAKYFGAHKPARSCVAVKTLPRNVLVEIELIAVVE